MAFPFILLAIILLAFVGLALLMPKPKIEDARPDALDKLQFPTSAEGSPVPLLLGSIRHRGPNTLWDGDFSSVPITKEVKTGLFSSKTVTVGFKYYIGLDLGLGLGPGVVLKRIWFEKDEVWAGTVGPDPTLLNIDKPSLWGGDEKGGGFSGNLRFYGGEMAQPINAYVASKVAPHDLPAYVGQSHIVLENCYIGTQATLHAISFELCRYTNGLGLGGGKNIIGSDLNPAELLFQLLTLDWGGLDVDPNDIDLPSFVEKAEVLYAEGNGMSLIISSANSGRDAIDEVLRQIDGIMYQDPVSGKIILSLIRKDYVVEDLLVLDPSNVGSVRSFSRTSWDDTVNQIRVTYTNRANKFEKGTATDQDLANINSQGRIRSVNFSFPGVTEGALATKLAAREMSQMSVPLFRATLEVNREAHRLRPGQAFVWSWPEYGIAQVVMRVQKFSLGDLIDGRIVIECVQDEFAIDATTFAPPADTLHEPTDRSALPITGRALAEVPFWMMQRQDFAIIPPSGPNVTFMMAVARKPGVYQQGYTATIEQAGLAAVAVDHQLYTDTAVLNVGFSRLAGFTTGSTSIIVDSPSDGGVWLKAAGSLAAGDNLFMLGAEIMSFSTFVNNGDGTTTLNGVRRGLLDSRAIDHVGGEVLYMLSVNPVSESEWQGSTAAVAKFQSFTDKDETPYAGASVANLVPNRRYERPLSPDWLTANGSRSPVIGTAGPHTMAWRPRTRLSSTVRLENDGADADEAGVTYTMRVWINGVAHGDLTQAGLLLPTADLTLPPGDAAVLVEVVSVRDGLESYTAGFIEFLSTVPIPTVALAVSAAAPAVSVATLGQIGHLTASSVATPAPLVSVAALTPPVDLNAQGIATPAPTVSSATVTPPTSTRWRIYTTALQSGTSWWSVPEVEMRATVGGADQCNAGVAVASASFGGAPAANAFDNNNGTIFQTGTTAMPQWLEYQFPAPVSVAELMIRSYTNAGDSPTDFLLQFYDGAAWVTALTVTETLWNVSQSRTFPVGGGKAASDNWRIKVTAVQTAGSFATIAEVEMRTVASGADQTAGGTAFASSIVGGSNPANAFDNSNATKWQANGSGLPAWLAYAFPADLSVVEVALTAPATNVGDTPTAVTIQKHDGASWVDVWSFTTPGTWTAGETRVFTKP